MDQNVGEIKSEVNFDDELEKLKSELNTDKPKQAVDLAQIKEEKPIASQDGESKDEVKKEAIEKEEPEEKDETLNEFYTEIDDIRPDDFKSTSKEQLDRLLRPGSTYFNLNPFEVLQIDPYAPLDDIKRRYKKLSMYVHPDKNKDDLERANIAFEAVNKAFKMLSDEKERKKCLEVVDEAREQVDKTCEEKRKKARKEALAAVTADTNSNVSTNKKAISIPEVRIEEDDPDKYRHSIYVMTCKLFADLERLRVKENEKKTEERKRRAEEKASDESKSKIKKEWDKNYEESRQGRVSSWQTFVKKGPSAAVSSSVKSAGFRPPKHKPEQR